VLIEFDDDDLRKLYVDLDFRLPRLGTDITRQFRKKIAIVVAAPDERDLIKMRSLRFEKLVGDREGQYSIRLNDQFRLILRLRSDREGRVASIVEVVDYH